MLLKRIYDHSTGKPVLDHVKVLRAKDMQNFSTKFVENGQANGLVTLAGDALILNTEPELIYKVIRRPGYYCCFDDQPVSDGHAAVAYIAKHHAGKDSPDSNNPSGYRRDNFYACEKVN